MDDDKDRPLYMISVAAELAGVHPQTLRIYERKRLLKPRRTAKQTRMYSDRDVERLRVIQELTQISRVNLAGVEMVIDLRERIEGLQQTIDEMTQQMERHREQVQEEIAQLHRSYRRDLVLLPRGPIQKR